MRGSAAKYGSWAREVRFQMSSDSSCLTTGKGIDAFSTECGCLINSYPWSSCSLLCLFILLHTALISTPLLPHLAAVQWSDRRLRSPHCHCHCRSLRDCPVGSFRELQLPQPNRVPSLKHARIRQSNQKTSSPPII
jgi:hypothetical protein